MKKLLSLLLALVMVLSLVACTPDDTDDQNPNPEPVTYDITVSYDDRYYFTKDVASFTEASISSKVAGTETADSSIVTLIGDSKRAAVITGVGTVKVNYTDGTSHMLKAEPAKISVLLIAGQSNAEGADGNAYRSVKSPAGTVYSTYAAAYQYTSGYCTESTYIQGNNELFSEYLNKDNGARYVAASLTSTKNVSGDDLEYKLNSLTADGTGKGGMDSAIANEWYEKMGEKVWIINCAHSGSIIQTWQKNYDDSALNAEDEAAKRANDRRNQYTEMNGVMQNVISTMEKEIAAGHYTLSHYGLFWCQGESDSGKSISQYAELFVSMYKSMKADWQINGKSLEFASIVATRTFARQSPYNTSNGVYTYADTVLNGVRLAQLYMGLNTTGDYADIYIGSNAGDRWVADDSYTEQYFSALYPDEDEFMEKYGYLRPTSMADVHYAGPHYTQFGYNELGRDAVRNTLAMKGWTTETPPSISNFGDMSVSNVYTLYTEGTFAQTSISDFEAQFKAEYYTWTAN